MTRAQEDPVEPAYFNLYTKDVDKVEIRRNELFIAVGDAIRQFHKEEDKHPHYSIEINYISADCSIQINVYYKPPDLEDLPGFSSECHLGKSSYIDISEFCGSSPRFIVCHTISSLMKQCHYSYMDSKEYHRNKSN